MNTVDDWAEAALATTLPRLLAHTTAQFPDKPALTDSGRTFTWQQAGEEVELLAAAFHALGLQRGQTILLMMSNRAEHWLADVAAAHLGAVSSTLHPSLSQDQVHAIASHSRARVVVLESSNQLRRWAKALRNHSTIEHVVVLDEAVMVGADHRFQTWSDLRARGAQRLRENPELVQRASAPISPGTPAAVMYPNEDSDQIKAVVLTHRNICFAAAALHQLTRPRPNTRRLSYLPLSHIAERVVGIYAAIHDAAHVHFCPEREDVLSQLRKARPTLFFASPEIWSRLAGALRDIPAEQRANARDGRRARERIGLGGTVWPSSRSGPINSEERELFRGIGLDVCELWGLTETTGCATTNHSDARRTGTVGRAMPGMEIRIAADGEVLVRGPLVCAGYLEADGLVRPATDTDGWLSTGDVGELDQDGYLTITGHKPELFGGGLPLAL
ncbi:long-chain fatty acid--CoA ligase [Saccharopolyspora rhizosphaerae]|uniref:Acyl-CoA synthetase n=1 Tax=Saccharopolyspora rhizosphaerae TaxID=2492662 RepID=A0A426JI18_9PSEU|nr:AMP-binding protein [Saccharopolyspora rhizosphaerae]RRO12690.1 long-chain fatty acid--CoA ligase [Saccharopolyspora rhizosphaerae]